MGTPSSAREFERLSGALEALREGEHARETLAEMERNALLELIATLKPSLKYLTEGRQIEQFRGGWQGGIEKQHIYGLWLDIRRKAEKYGTYHYDLVIRGDGVLLVLRSIYVVSEDRRTHEFPLEYTVEEFLKANVPAMLGRLDMHLAELFPVEEIFRATMSAAEQILSKRRKHIQATEKRVNELSKIRQNIVEFKRRLLKQNQP